MQLRWLFCVVMLCAACGPNAQDLSGAYQGKLTVSEREDMIRYTREEPTYFVYVTPDTSEGVVVQLSEGCAAAGTLDGDAVTLVQATCKDGGASTFKDVTVNGSGTFDGESLTLTWTMKGKLTRGDKTLDYEGEFKYEGDVQ